MNRVNCTIWPLDAVHLNGRLLWFVFSLSLFFSSCFPIVFLKHFSICVLRSLSIHQKSFFSLVSESIELLCWKKLQQCINEFFFVLICWVHRVQCSLDYRALCMPFMQWMMVVVRAMFGLPFFFFSFLLLLQRVVHRRSFSVHRDYRCKNVIIFVNSQQYLYANNAHEYTNTRTKIYTWN